MKDQRFTELINLYVDRQITADETTELENELQVNPRRRSVYRQYCQMHRATALVYESFRADAPNQQPDIAAGRATIARFENPSRQRAGHWAYYAGGLAAACLALVLVRVHSNRAAEANLAALTKSSQPAVVAAALPTVAAKPLEVAKVRAGLVSLRNNSLATEQDYAAMLAALRQEERQALASGQIQSGRLPSLFEDGVFESQQLLPANSQRSFRGKETPVEQVSFTFQR
jgi:hypothetical protein